MNSMFRNFRTSEWTLLVAAMTATMAGDVYAAKGRIWYTKHYPGASDERWRMTSSGTHKERVSNVGEPNAFTAIAAGTQDGNINFGTVFYAYSNTPTTSKMWITGTNGDYLGHYHDEEDGVISAIVYDETTLPCTMRVAVGSRVYTGCFAHWNVIYDTGAVIKPGSLATWGDSELLITTNGVGLAFQGIISVLVPGSDFSGVAVNDGYVYWGEESPPRIRRMNTSGAEQMTVLDLENPPVFLAVDRNSTGGGATHVYWVERGTPMTILRSTLDGNDVRVLDSAVSYSSFAVEWGRPCDPTLPFGDVNGNEIVDFADVASVVACFQGAASCSHMLFYTSDLFPCQGINCIGDGVLDFRDVSAGVAAFRGEGCR